MALQLQRRRVIELTVVRPNLFHPVADALGHDRFERPSAFVIVSLAWTISLTLHLLILGWLLS